MKKETHQQASPPGACPLLLRRVVSCLVIAHLLAVLAEPLAFFSRSDFQVAPEFLALRRVAAPYAEWMYLDHGYFFFAPNPGPNHLVGWKANTAKSDQLPEVLFPDRRQQWPRLRYHRYFMLSEFYNNSFAPTELLPEDRQNPEFYKRWTDDRRFYEALQRSITNRMFSASSPEASSQEASSQEASRATQNSQTPNRVPSLEPGQLVRLERPLPSIDEYFTEGQRLDDSRRLIELSDSPVRWAQENTSDKSTEEQSDPATLVVPEVNQKPSAP